MKVSTIISSVPTLEKIDTTSLKLSTAYKISKILVETKAIVADYEKRRIALASEHGTLNEDGTHYTFDDESIHVFNKGMEAIHNDEIELGIKKIHLSELDDTVTLSPAEIPSVEWFIEGFED